MKESVNRMDTNISEKRMSIEEKKRYINRYNSFPDVIRFYDAFCVRPALADNFRPKSPFYAHGI